MTRSWSLPVALVALSASGCSGAPSSSSGVPEERDGSAVQSDAASEPPIVEAGAPDAPEERRSEEAATIDVLREASTDASVDAATEAGWADAAPPDRVKAIIGVGYGGIRVVSRDQGKTWSDRAAFAADGADDENLLRAVVYGKGLWIATGWKIVTSNDGVHWTDHGLITKLPDPRPSCNIIEGLAFKDPAFYAACDGSSFRSDDGLRWTRVGPIGNTGGHLFLTYRGDQFIAYGDTKTSFRSTDGASWSILPGIDQATFCEGQFKSQADCHDASWFDGVYLRPEWKSKILRSTSGAKFDSVYVDDMQNTLYQGRAFAEGYVSP